MNSEIIRCSNSSVTDFYLDTIKTACELVPSNEKVTIVARFQDLIPCRLKKKRVIYWVQGVDAEEFHMRHSNRLKEYAINLCVKYALKKADFVVFVSEEMRRHFERKYKLYFEEYKYYVMPCFNTRLIQSSFLPSTKYKKNVFTYIGSLEAWQGFDHILDCYRKIEDLNLPDTQLLVLTSDKEAAKKKLEEKGISNYTISYCANKDLPQVLKEVKYGFILREDNVVNNVATPTKISTYMANGIIPIYSKSINSFHELSQNLKFVIEEDELLEKVSSFHDNILNVEVLREYERVFDTYYSADYHIKKMGAKLKKVF